MVKSDSCVPLWNTTSAVWIVYKQGCAHKLLRDRRLHKIDIIGLLSDQHCSELAFKRNKRCLREAELLYDM